MLWKRLSLTKKIFLTISLTAAMIVIIMAGLVALSMRDGFAKYLLQAEINRLDDLETALSRSYDPKTQGWPALDGPERAWISFVAENLGPEPERMRPAPEHAMPEARPNAFDAEGFLPPPPERNAPPHLTERIVLLDRNRSVIAGTHQRGDQSVERAIYLPGQSNTSEPVGWIRLLAPMGAAGPPDTIFLRGQYKSLLIASLVALGLSLAVALFLARQFLTPIRELAAGSSRLASGEFTSRIAHNRHDELGRLMDDYNVLAQSLDHSERAERQWITDTSHELQTPLAILRAEIEAIQDGVRKPNAENLGSLHASVMRLSALVRDINALSRTREGTPSLCLENVDLSTIIEEAICTAAEGLKSAEISISSHIDEDLKVYCDQFRMRQVMDNLLENSKRYTSAKGHIGIKAGITDSGVFISIEDTAPCPPEDTIEHLFKRFYRVEQSRSREYGGSGLGLSICDAIIRAHGGEIKAQPSQSGGLKITMTLPAN